MGLSTFEGSHIFGTMCARILKFLVCTAYEKFAGLYIYIFFSVRIFMVKLALFSMFSDLRILANENLVSKISKKPLDLGP